MIIGNVILPLLSRLFSVGVALTLMGASAAQQTKGSATVSLVELRKNLGELQAQVSETTGALEELKKKANTGSDLKPAHTAFAGKLKQLESHIEKLRSESTQMRARADDQYKAWQTELSKMGNPKLREKALNRYGDAKEEFDQIIVIAEEAKREIGPFMADLKDVAVYLEADLSADALKTLSNTIWKLGNKSRAVVASIQHVGSQISRALEQLPEGK